MENLNFRSDWDGYETLTEEELSRVSGGRDNSFDRKESLTELENRMRRQRQAAEERIRAERAARESGRAILDAAELTRRLQQLQEQRQLRRR